MDYEAIQVLRRNILAGHILAPHRFPEAPQEPIPRKRKRFVEEFKADDGEWDDDGFMDNLYYDEEIDNGHNEDERDVVPDYFKNCEQLITTYAAPALDEEDLPCEPLFPGSAYETKDLARFLLSFKARHLKIGDGLIAHIVGILATFLPKGNTFQQRLPAQPSTYFLLKTLDNLAAYKTNLRTLKIHCCIKECMGYYGGNMNLNVCSVCDECRWKQCIPACYGDGGEKLCEHNQSPRRTLYYNVVQDRLVKLLKSDLKNLFNYQHHRAGELICAPVYIF